MTDISIIVPAYNEAHDLPDLLDSLRPALANDRFEVIVVDNGSTDDTARIASAAGARVVSIPRAHVGAGRNAGARAAQGRLLAFLDADVIVTPQWLQRIGEVWQLSGSITGDVYDIVEHPSWIERHWFGAFYVRGARRYLNGGNLVIAHSDFETASGFNEQMISGEDVEFCERAGTRGIPVIPDRGLRVLHKGYPASAGGFLRREAWHGRADYNSLKSFMCSPVAQVAMLFAALHALVLVALIVGQFWLAGAALAGIVLICLASALWKWRCVSLRSRLACAVVFYLYYAGRAAAAWDELRKK